MGGRGAAKSDDLRVATFIPAIFELNAQVCGVGACHLFICQSKFGFGTRRRSVAASLGCT